MSEAVGLLEVYGLTAAFVAGDAACKAAGVTIEALDRNKPANAESLPVPLLIVLKIRGGIEDVIAGLEAGEAAAAAVSGVVARHVIARPEQDTELLLNIMDIDKAK